MIDTVLGLPTHPLVVHAVVVLLPLLAVATAALAWLPARWPAWSVPVLVLDVGVAGLTVLAKESGERLEHRIAETPQIESHGELGGTLPYVAVALLLCAAVIALLARRGAPTSSGAPGSARPRLGGTNLVVALLTTAVALVGLYWTARVGHSGAVAVWGHVVG